MRLSFMRNEDLDEEHIKWNQVGQIQWQAITILYVHFISLANQPHILRVFTVPSSLFFPETCPESARLIKQDETITRQVILLLTMGCGQVVEAPVSLGSFRFPLMSSGSKTATPISANNALPPSTITVTAGM